MKTQIKWIVLIFAVTLINGYGMPDASHGVGPMGVTVTRDGKTLFIIARDNSAILKVDAQSGKILAGKSLPHAANSMTLNQRQDLLYVGTDNPDGEVCVFNCNNMQVVKSYQAGHTTMFPQLDEDKGVMYVCNRFNNNVSVIDLKTGKTIKTIAVTREPVTSLLSKDRKLLVVGNHLTANSATEGHVSCVVSMIDTSTYEVTHIRLEDGTSGLRSMCFSPDEKYIYATSILGRHRVPATHIERGWVNTNVVSILDARNKKLVATVLLDDVNRGAANPWAIRSDDDHLYVALSGTHEVMKIDTAGMHEKIGKSEAANISHDLSFLTGLKKRIKMPGQGGRELAIHDGKLYVAQYFSDSLTILDIDTEKTTTIKLTEDRQMSQVRRGHFLFTDAGFCFQNWQSCSSCHPDSRTDGLNWDLPNDGLGTPKQAKNMLFAHFTPPTTVTGVRPDAETSVRAGIRFFMCVLPKEDAEAIDAYLKSLTPVPSPHLVKGKLSPSAQRGKLAFKKAKCTKCHNGDYFTDMKLHDTDTGVDLEIGKKYDTPTLKEIWRTAPYLHNGRAKSIDEVINKFNPDDEHGFVSDLTDKEKKDLIEYVLSL